MAAIVDSFKHSSAWKFGSSGTAGMAGVDERERGSERRSQMLTHTDGARGVWPITHNLSIGRMTVPRYGEPSITFDSPAEGYGMRTRVRRTTTRSIRLG